MQYCPPEEGEYIGMNYKQQHCLLGEIYKGGEVFIQSLKGQQEREEEVEEEKMRETEAERRIHE